MTTGPQPRTALLTAATMVAFAGNSLLCRAALAPGAIDAVSFTTVRVASGALVLAALVRARGSTHSAGSWGSALALWAYAIAFSLAYTRIPAGAGALLLFGAVQVTMIGYALAGGARLRPGEWLGLLLALTGLVVLTRPGLEAPDPAGAVAMTVAGAAWGVYSLRGRGQRDPLGVTAGNFGRATAPALALSLVSIAIARPQGSVGGLLLAAASGALASGLGYAIWYSALPGLSTTGAAVVQLSVPLLAALGAVAILDEPFTQRLGVASPLLLGGIALAVLVRAKR